MLKNAAILLPTPKTWVNRRYWLSLDQSGKWKGNGHIISIDGSKFYDFSPTVQRGGGGSIDLAMHVKNVLSLLQSRGYMIDLEKMGLKGQRWHTRSHQQQLTQTPKLNSRTRGKI